MARKAEAQVVIRGKDETQQAFKQVNTSLESMNTKLAAAGQALAGAFSISALTSAVQGIAAAADSYARARLAGHPVIALLVGKAMSGAFLAHGYQANRLIALRDPGVMVHAMGKASAARVTLRSVEELEALAASVPPMAYDIDSYASLGLLWETLTVTQIEQPTADDVARVHDCLVQAVKDIGSTDLSSRLGATNRAASSHVRQLLREQW